MANGGTPFQRALQTSTPGFDSLLKTIQQETSRLERNRQLIQQRKMKRDMLEHKTDLEIEAFKKTTAAENQKNRQLQRDIAEMEAGQSQTEARADLLQSQNEELSEAKREQAKQYKKEWRNRYNEVVNANFDVPVVRDVTMNGNSPQDLDPVYELSDGSTMSPHEYDQKYGKSTAALDFIKEYDNIRDDERFKGGTFSEKVQGNFTNAVGESINVGEDLLGKPSEDEEPAKQTVTKQYLGRTEAAQKLDQLRNGNWEVLKKFQDGRLDFNTLKPGEGKVIRELNAQRESVLSDIQTREADKYTESMGVLGGALSGATAVGTYGSFGGFGGAAVGATIGAIGGGIAGSFGLGIPFKDIGSGKSLDKFKVNRIRDNLADEGEDKLVQTVNSMKLKYAQLENSKKDVDDLYFNPIYNSSTPASDMFLTQEEFESINEENTVGTQSDVQNAEGYIRKQQSAGFLNSVLTQPELKPTQAGTTGVNNN